MCMVWNFKVYAYVHVVPENYIHTLTTQGIIIVQDPPPPLNFQFLNTNVPYAHTQKYFLRYDVHPHTLSKNSFWQVKVKIAVYYFW